MRRSMPLRAAVIGAVVLAIAALAAETARAEERTMQRSITVSATGAVSATPDRARINAGVVTEAKSAREALDANTVAMKAVIAELKSSGIEAKDIQTSTFSVDPVTVYDRDGQPPRITGYRVTNQVAVIVRDLGKVGAVLDQLISAGANQSGGLEFEVSNAETAKDEARKEAVANALRRAKLLAVAAGANVGDVLQISEEVASQGPRPMTFTRAAKSDSVPIEVGESTLEVRITATWALK